MSAKRKPPRLWLKPTGRDRDGRITHHATWYVKEGSHRESTGCSEDDAQGAAAYLGAYISRRHLEESLKGSRRADQVPVADVIALYLRDVVNGHARPKETKARLSSILEFFGDKMLSDIMASCAEHIPRGRRPTARLDALWRICVRQSNIIEKKESVPRWWKLSCHDGDHTGKDGLPGWRQRD
jgi:hypothetical protein